MEVPRPTWSRFVLVCLAFHVERLGAQPVQGARWPKAASDFVASSRRPCPNGIDHESCQHLQYAVSGAAAPTARRTSDSSTVGMGAIPMAVNRLLHSIEAKRPKFGRDRRRSHEIGHHPSNLFGGARRIRSGRGGLNQAIHILRGF